MSLSFPEPIIPPSSCNVKEAVMAAVGKLKAIASNPTSYPRADKSIHLFLLASELDYG